MVEIGRNTIKNNNKYLSKANKNSPLISIIYNTYRLVDY